MRQRGAEAASADAAGMLHARELHAALLSRDSATETLERFFGAPVSAERVRERAEAPDAARRLLFGLGVGEAVRHRRSRLCARGVLLVVADLWYVPGRLPEERVAALVGTRLPFGRVMRGLGLKRVLLESRFGGAGARVALWHHAVLHGADGAPVAEVVERYCGSALGGRMETR